MLFTILKRIPPKVLLSSPGLTASLMLTRRCNFTCSFCEVIKRNNKRELHVDGWKKIIDQLSDKFLAFGLTGGEAILYDGIEEIIEYARKKNIVALFTNGALLSDKVLEKIKHIDYLNISSTPWISDGQGEESFFWDKLEYLKNKYGVVLSSTQLITPGNMEQIPFIIKKLTLKGIYTELCLVHTRTDRQYIHQYRTDSTHHNFSDQDLIKLDRLAKLLIQMKRKGYLIGTSDSYLRGMVGYLKGKKSVYCQAGKKFLMVNNDGMVSPCHDLSPSESSALEIKSKKDLKQLSQKVPTSCRCWWDCNHMASFLTLKLTPTNVIEFLLFLQNTLAYYLRHKMLRKIWNQQDSLAIKNHPVSR